MYGALSLIAIAVSYYIYTDINKTPTAGTFEETKEQAAKTDESVDNGDALQDITTSTKNIVSLTMPKLNRPVPTNTSLSEEVRTILVGRIKEWSDKIAKEPNNSESWVFLGVEYKIAGDYEGAREAWEYASYLSPNSVAQQNLGDLYAYYLKDFAKAEAHFLEAIRISPGSIYLYFKISDFYKDSLKDSAKARAIVERGLAANPSSSELQSLLSSLR